MKLKEKFPLAEKLVYFDNAVMGCAPQSTLDLMKNYMDALVDHMGGKRQWAFNVEEGKGALDNARELFAKVIGAEKEEVHGVPNASTGMNVAMSMLPVKKGDNIVSTDLAFPMGAALVQKAVEKGAEARWLPSNKGVIEVEAFEKEYLILALKEYNGRLKKVVERSGLNARTLYRKMKRYGLDKKQF